MRTFPNARTAFGPLTRLVLLFALIWTAVAMAGWMGINLVRGEVVERARGEAARAAASAADALDQSIELAAPLARGEARAVRTQTLRLGQPSLVMEAGRPTLKFGPKEVTSGSLDNLARRMGGSALVYAAADGAFVLVAISPLSDGAAPMRNGAIPASSSMAVALRSGRAASGPLEIGGGAMFVSSNPIAGKGGKVIGAWGAAYPLSGLETATRAFAASPVFAHGMLAVLDANGEPLVRSRRLAPNAVEAVLAGLPQSHSAYHLLGVANAKGGLRVVALADEADLTLQAIRLDAASLAFLGVVVVLALCLAWLGARRLISAVAQAERSRAEAEVAKASAEAANAALLDELNRAARYVASLLPEASRDGAVASDWVYAPSAGVGGDAFGYHWIDERHFAFYLLDVCGHGVGAALLATTVMNLLRSGRVEGADLASPGSVVTALNAAFPMAAQNGMYFTMFYGVYDAPRREVTFAAAGHHPAVLVAQGAGPELLKAKGLPIGCFDKVVYPEGRAAVAPGSRLYLFSDGVFEVEVKSSQDMFSFEAFVEVIMHWQVRREGRKLTDVIETIQNVQGKSAFDDDCALLEFEFVQEGSARAVA